jgi:hypothetical protein
MIFYAENSGFHLSFLENKCKVLKLHLGYEFGKNIERKVSTF